MHDRCRPLDRPPHPAPPNRRTAWTRFTAPALLLVVLGTPAVAGPNPDNHDNGRRRGSQGGAGGSNATAALSVPVEARMVEAVALSKGQLESCEPIEGVLPVFGQPEGECPTLPGGVAHAAAGCGARNAGFCTVGLRGVEPESTLVLARLYVMLILDDEDAFQPLNAGFNGHAITLMPVGLSEPPCWTGTEDASSVLFAADVGPFVPATINGDYAVTGLPSAITSGASPYLDHPTDPPMAQGAALVVAYSHAKVPDDSIVYIHEDQLGIPVLAEGQTIQHDLSLPTPEAGTVRFTSIGSDGQGLDGGPLVPFDTYFTTGTTTLHLRGATSPVDPHADWTGADGGSMVALFDTRTTEFGGDSTTLPTGTLAYDVTYVATPPPGWELAGAFEPGLKNDPTLPSYDCVNVGVHVLTVCGSPSYPD